MIARRFFSRDSYSQRRRLSLALLLSVTVHLSLIFSLQAIQVTAPPKPATIIEARLMGTREMRPNVISAAEKPVSRPLPELVKSVRQRHKPVAPLMPPKQSPVAALPLSFDPIFYTWREVDVVAKLQGVASPSYPKAAAEAGVSGRLSIEVWIDETGKVDDVKIIEVDPPGYFEEATLAYYKTLRFSPAMKEGRAKRYRAPFLVEFGITSNGSTPGAR